MIFSPPAAKASTTKLYVASAVFITLSVSAALLAISFVYCPGHVGDTLVGELRGISVLTHQITWIRPVCEDEHYKYLVPLLVPITSWFVIANWVGWEYFRYA